MQISPKSLTEPVLPAKCCESEQTMQDNMVTRGKDYLRRQREYRWHRRVFKPVAGLNSNPPEEAILNVTCDPILSIESAREVGTGTEAFSLKRLCTAYHDDFI